MKNLSCLEADILTNIIISDEYGMSEDALISDYTINILELPWCAYDTSVVLRGCDCQHKLDDKKYSYSDEHIKMIVKYSLTMLKSKGLIREEDNQYFATNNEYVDALNLLKDKAARCSRFRNYVKHSYDYFEQDEIPFILGDEYGSHDEEGFEEEFVADLEEELEEGSEDTLSNYEHVSPMIRQSISNNISDKETNKILNYFTNAHVVTMNSNGKSYKYLPLFATVFDDSLYFIMSPLFKNELGDEVALVFKRNEDHFTIVTDGEMTETILGLYQAAKERDINGK